MVSDIQKLKAVDRLEVRESLLHDHYNVIVFSSKGERPDFNKMAKGDLDGDTYFVCWDPELIKYDVPFKSEPDPRIDPSIY